MISYSGSMSKNPSRHTRFKTFVPKTMDQFLEILVTRVWSPVIWKSGFRSRNNFARATLVALDFDSGEMTLGAMEKECKDLGLWYVLATTKSHQVAKVSRSGEAIPATDRFRLILRSEKTCIDRERYEYNMKLFPEYWPCDPSCSDAARFFWPCREVVSYSEDGLKLPWLNFDEDYVPERLRYIRHAEKLRNMGRHGMMPEWVSVILHGTKRVPRGERHKTCYRLGATWMLLGWELDTLIDYVNDTSLAKINDEYGPGDMERALRNGFEANENYNVHFMG